MVSSNSLYNMFWGKSQRAFVTIVPKTRNTSNDKGNKKSLHRENEIDETVLSQYATLNCSDNATKDRSMA